MSFQVSHSIDTRTLLHTNLSQSHLIETHKIPFYYNVFPNKQ